MMIVVMATCLFAAAVTQVDRVNNQRERVTRNNLIPASYQVQCTRVVQYVDFTLQNKDLFH